jgi:hypothetical protein
MERPYLFPIVLFVLIIFVLCVLYIVCVVCGVIRRIICMPTLDRSTTIQCGTGR